MSNKAAYTVNTQKSPYSLDELMDSPELVVYNKK